jgi:hypothetical protein
MPPSLCRPDGPPFLPCVDSVAVRPVPSSVATSQADETSESKIPALVDTAWHEIETYKSYVIFIRDSLTSGLEDDWSQIRHAASLACQSFLLAFQGSALLDTCWPLLLPRLCMNRFYPAVAVQTVSQATRRDSLGPNALGRTLLAHHAAAVVDYYYSLALLRAVSQLNR